MNINEVKIMLFLLHTDDEYEQHNGEYSKSM